MFSNRTYENLKITHMHCMLNYVYGSWEAKWFATARIQFLAMNHAVQSWTFKQFHAMTLLLFLFLPLSLIHSSSPTNCFISCGVLRTFHWGKGARKIKTVCCITCILTYCKKLCLYDKLRYALHRRYPSSSTPWIPPSFDLMTDKSPALL